jgi:hypothetical protein
LFIFFSFLFSFFLLPYLQNTNYKNSKLNKYYIKQFGNYKITTQNSITVLGSPSGTAMNSGGASSHAPPLLAARGFTRRRKKGRKTGGSGSTSFPFPFSAGGDTHRHLQKNKNPTNSRFQSILV